MATVQPQSPAGPTPSPPQEGWHGDAPGPPAASGEPPAAAAVAGPGGEIAALDKQLAVVGGGEETKPDGGASAGASGGKLVAEAMRKYAAPRSSRFHGVTRCGLAILWNRELRALPVLVPLLVLWIDRLFAAALAAG